MPEPMLALAGATIGSSVIGGISSNKAAKAQVKSDALAIAEQRAARAEMRQLLADYVSAGGAALPDLLALAGVGGDQQAAVDELSTSPIFQSLAAQGEEGILANASATGGLRGGDVQGALARFRPQLLNQFIADQFGRLGSIVSMGQNSAAGVGTSGMDSANAISALMADQGAARAGGTLGVGNAVSSGVNNLGSMFFLQSLMSRPQAAF